MALATSTKIPVSLGGLADIMEIGKSELSNFQYLTQLRDSVKDYNFKGDVDILTQSIDNILEKLSAAEKFIYGKALENISMRVKVF